MQQCLFVKYGETHILLSKHWQIQLLDLSFCSPSVFTDFKWDVLDNPYGSDHLPVIISLASSPSITLTKPRRWKLNLADWALFREEAALEEIFSDSSDVDKLNETFTARIIAAAYLAIPRTSGVVRQNRKAWYTQECRKAKKEQNKAWGILRRYPTHENLINFKKAKSKARYIRRTAEKQSWQRYVSSINSSVTSKDMWEKVHKLDGKYSPFTVPFFTTSGAQTSIEEQADILGEYFAAVSSSTHYTQSFLKYKSTVEKQKLPMTGSMNEPFNALITLEEIHRVLSAGKHTAPGPDDVHYEMLAHLSETSVEALLKLFNKIWISGKIPESWKKAIVVPLLKPGKSPNSPGSYRPIALTSCLAKCFESILNIRLMFVLESQKLLDTHQCGFRKTCSTTDHLVRLENTVREAFLHKQHCLAVFFDLEKAYDTTWRFGILRDLGELGIRGRMLKCLADFLHNRSFQVRLGSVLSKNFTQETGVPQGCILSTTLFIVKMNSIAKVIPKSIMYSVYVDDLQIACTSSNVTTCERQIQLTVNKLASWQIKMVSSFPRKSLWLFSFLLDEDCTLTPPST